MAGGGFGSRFNDGGAASPSPSSGGSGGFGGRFGGGSSSAPPKKKSGGHHGFLGELGHVLAQGGIDLKNVAYHAPGGAYQVGRAVGSNALGEVSFGKLGDRNAVYNRIVVPEVHALVSDLKHPLRHPGYTLLDLLPGLNVAAKVAEASRLARTGATASEIASAAVRGSRGARTLRRGDLEVRAESSNSALGRAGQRLGDRALQRAAGKKPGGHADRLLAHKIGKTLAAEARTIKKIHEANGAALIALGRKLKPAEQKALQVVAEEAPLEGRITAEAARVLGAKNPKARRRHQAELDLLHQAKQHLGEQNGKPILAGPRAPKLTHALGRMRQVAGSREELLKSLGQLTDEAIQGRKEKAARAALGQSLEQTTHELPTPGQGALFEEQTQPLFKPSAEAVRIPDVATRRGARGLRRDASVGSQGSVGHLKAPGSTTHEYTGALREHAVRRQDTTTLVGESGMEAAKFAALRHVHDLVRKAATPEPTFKSDVAVRLDKLKPHERLPLEARKFLDDPEEFFKTASPKEQGAAFEGLRARLFFRPKELDAQAAAEFRQLQADGKIGWVPRDLLGELAKPHVPYGGKAIRATDAINNASRLAILYLKPAYALPNVLGNAALNLLQQGFAAVPNLTRAARLNHTLGEEAAARIDTLMGEGFARAVASHGQGIGHAAVDKAASIWSKGVDTPFRRSAFLYEARRAGYKTPSELERLLTEPRHTADLSEITQRANREIIDYANLTPSEREIVRRVIFFYPWVKGSTVYAGRLLREHPVKSAAVGQLGQIGKRNDLPAPTYLEGAFDVGGRLVNPASAAVFQTPAQVGQALAGLAGGDVGEAGQLANFASPAAALALAMASGRDRGGYQYKKRDLGHVAFDQLVKQTPQYLLGQRVSDAVHGRGQDRLYPPNIPDAVLQFLLGGVAPRRYNKAKLAELKANERSRYVP